MPTSLLTRPDQRFIGPVEDVLALPLNEKVRALVEHWRAIAPPGKLPGRQHLDPMDIPHLLPNVWLVDVVHGPPMRFRYRLIGTSVARAFAQDSTGRWLDEAHAGRDRREVERYLHEVVVKRLPSWRTGKPRFWALQDFLNLERVYLPQARDGETVDMILALTVFVDRDGQEF